MWKTLYFTKSFFYKIVINSKKFAKKMGLPRHFSQKKQTSKPMQNCFSNKKSTKNYLCGHLWEKKQIDKTLKKYKKKQLVSKYKLTSIVIRC